MKLMMMVKLNKLQYDQFTEDELNQLITPYFPQKMPLTVPVVNLLVPILGAAAFTHLYHRLEARD